MPAKFAKALRADQVLRSDRRDAEEAAANMSKLPDVERVSVAAYGRIIAAFKGGVQIDLETP
jgi:hypothetical protein